MKGLGKCFDGRNVVYRFYDADDELLYVGSTYRLPMRMASHSAASPWWPEVARVIWRFYPTLGWALYAEDRAIAFERPRYNVKGQLSDESRNDPQMMAKLRAFYDSVGEPWSVAS